MPGPTKVVSFIKQRSRSDFQCIVISLKDIFYEQADALVGVCKDVGTNSSLALTLDLTQFDAEAPALGEADSPSTDTDGSPGRMRRAGGLAAEDGEGGGEEGDGMDEY